MREALAGLGASAALAASGCSDPRYDTSTPQRAIDAAQAMVRDGRPEFLPTLIHLQPREDVEYDDGVTEASAVEDVRGKTGEMLAQLWRVARKLGERFPDEVERELAAAAGAAGRAADAAGAGTAARSRTERTVARLLIDPGGIVEEQRARLEVEDLGDGTAALLVDGEPAFGGLLGMVETDEGWRLSIPVETARSSGWWPDTREEWAVVAAMMLGVENSLSQFEEELDDGRFDSLRAASERAGRMVGESVVVQSIIYAQMKGRL